MHSGVFWNCLAWKCQVIGFLFTPEIKTWCVRCKIWQHLNCIEGYYAWRYYLCLYVSNWIVCKMAGTGFELAAATANPALQKWRVHTCTVALGAVSTAVIWTCVCTSCGHLWEEWNCFRVKKFSFSGQQAVGNSTSKSSEKEYTPALSLCLFGATATVIAMTVFLLKIPC